MTQEPIKHLEIVTPAGVTIATYSNNDGHCRITFGRDSGDVELIWFVPLDGGVIHRMPAAQHQRRLEAALGRAMTFDEIAAIFGNSEDQIEKRRERGTIAISSDVPQQGPDGRARYYSQAIAGGWMTVNEVRAIEGFPPIQPTTGDAT